MTDKTFKQHIKKCGDLKAKIDDLKALYDAEKECIIRELKVRDIGDYKACHAYINEIHSSKFTVKSI